MTLKDFSSVFAMLSVQLRNSESDEAAVRAYFEALKDFPLPSIQESAAILAREQNRRFFPTTAEWHDIATTVNTEVIRAQLTSGERGFWHHDCETCEDTGWRVFQCAGKTDCDRNYDHAPHEFVRPCVCRSTNRTYQRHHLA